MGHNYYGGNTILQCALKEALCKRLLNTTFQSYFN